MPSLAQILRYVRAADACLRCSASVNLHQDAPSVLSFVRNLADECRPRGIIDTHGKHPPRQAFNVQLLDGDQTMIIDQPTSNLMVKVGPLVANVRVNPLQKLEGLAAATAPLLTPRHFALRTAEFLLRLPVPARVIYLSTVRKGSERSKADVNTDRLRTCG